MESPSLDTKLDWGAKVFSEEPIKSGIQVVYSCHLIGTKQVLGMLLSFHLQVPNQACHSNVLFLLRILAPVRFRNLILYACMHLLPSPIFVRITETKHTNKHFTHILCMYI